MNCRHPGRRGKGERHASTGSPSKNTLTKVSRTWTRRRCSCPAVTGRGDAPSPGYCDSDPRRKAACTFGPPAKALAYTEISLSSGVSGSSTGRPGPSKASPTLRHWLPPSVVNRSVTSKSRGTVSKNRIAAVIGPSRFCSSPPGTTDHSPPSKLQRFESNDSKPSVITPATGAAATAETPSDVASTSDSRCCARAASSSAVNRACSAAANCPRAAATCASITHGCRSGCHATGGNTTGLTTNSPNAKIDGTPGVMTVVRSGRASSPRINLHVGSSNKPS